MGSFELSCEPVIIISHGFPSTVNTCDFIFIWSHDLIVVKICPSALAPPLPPFSCLYSLTQIFHNYCLDACVRQVYELSQLPCYFSMRLMFGIKKSLLISWHLGHKYAPTDLVLTPSNRHRHGSEHSLLTVRKGTPLFHFQKVQIVQKYSVFHPCFPFPTLTISFQLTIHFYQ